MTKSLFMQCLDIVHEVVEDNWEHLSALDQAIGDGDHGANVRRGVNAVVEDAETLATLPFGDACRSASMILVKSVGGASGPLLWSLVKGFASACPEEPTSQADFSRMLRTGTDNVKNIGKSDVGMKTMLDVLEPMATTLAIQSDATSADIAALARNSADATKDIVATKGRAAFLGERSMGHVDPGAETIALVTDALCKKLGAPS